MTNRKNLFLTFIILFWCRLSLADDTTPILRNLPPLDQMIPIAIQTQIAAKRRLRASKRQSDLSIMDVIPNRVDLRWRDTGIQVQVLNNCTAFALVAAMENMLQGKVKLSENHLWYLYQKPNPVPAISAASANRITYEYYWPYWNSNPYQNFNQYSYYYLQSSRYLDDPVNDSLISLANGYPVFLTFSLTDDFYKCTARPDPNSPVNGLGHAVEIVGYDWSEQRFIVKNSWGTNCGDAGYQYIPFDYCRRSDMFCVAWAIYGVSGT